MIDIEVPAVATLTLQVTPTASLTLTLRSMNSGDLARLLPPGGTTGQVARKHSNTDYDVEWHTQTASDVGAPSGSGSSTGTNTGDQDLSGLAAKRAYVSLSDANSITPALIAGDTTCVKQSNTQTAGTLTVNNPTGSPTDGQLLMLRVTCTNAQTFAFGTSYAGTNQLSLPSAATGSSKTDRMLFEYRTTASMWQLIGISFGA